MIQVQITKVVSTYDLRTMREEPDYAVIELPNGEELRAPITRAHLSYFGSLMAGNMGQRRMEVAEPPPQTVKAAEMQWAEVVGQAEQSGSVEEVEPEEETAEVVDKQDPLVTWMDLPEVILSTNVKKAMTAIGDLPKELNLSLVTQIRDKILEEFSEQDWAQVGVMPAQAPAVTASQSDSRVMVDAAGNPIPQQEEPDPGEVAEDEEDDGDQF